MLSFWAGGISSSPPPCAREYRLLRRLSVTRFFVLSLLSFVASSNQIRAHRKQPRMVREIISSQWSPKKQEAKRKKNGRYNVCQ